MWDTLYDEARYQTTRRGRIIAATLAVVAFSFLALVYGGGVFLSRAMQPVRGVESANPTGLLGNTDTIQFQTRDGQTHSGWFLPGLRGAPVIIVCHGYKSNRSEVLTLATALQQHRYNVFVFNLAGHGDSPVEYTTFGYRETDEVLAVIQMLSQRTDIDTRHIGLWGYNMGGYAALTAAAEVPGVRAVVVDSVYPYPSSLLQSELGRLGAGRIPFLISITALEFHLVTLFQPSHPPPPQALPKLAGVHKLFISGDDRPTLAALTQELFAQAPGPKEFKALPRSNVAFMREDDRNAYENLVVTFFLDHLPLISTGP